MQLKNTANLTGKRLCGYSYHLHSSHHILPTRDQSQTDILVSAWSCFRYVHDFGSGLRHW